MFALTDTGKIFYLPLADLQANSISWTDVRLPAGCIVEEQVPVALTPPFVSKPEQKVVVTVPPPLPSGVERKIDVSALPPKLASVFSGDTPSFCDVCGMPMRGSECIECKL